MLFSAFLIKAEFTSTSDILHDRTISDGIRESRGVKYGQASTSPVSSIAEKEQVAILEGKTIRSLLKPYSL